MLNESSHLDTDHQHTPESDPQIVTDQQESVVTRQEAKAAEKSGRNPRRGLILGGISVATTAVIAAGAIIGIGAINGDKAGDKPPQGVETSEPAVTWESEIAEVLAARAAEGSAEYATLVDSMRISSAEYATPDEAGLAFGHSVVTNMFNAGFNEVPKDFYDQAIALSLDEKAEKLQPEYWKGVFSQALFGKPLSEISPAQTNYVENIYSDYVNFLKQRITTASEDSPTSVQPLTESITSEDAGAETAYGTYNYTIQPNANNSFGEMSDVNEPTAHTLSYTLDLNSDTGYWDLRGAQ